MFIQYGEKENAYLKNRDRQLGAAIDCIGHIQRSTESDLFSSIIRHIIGQQISIHAQDTIWQRLCEKSDSVSAKSICALELNTLQRLGMTFKKAEYIREFAEKVRDGKFDLRALSELPDAELIKELTTLKGVGKWTAVMVMIFCMKRPDIVSYGDLAIRRGMRMLYQHRELDQNKFAKHAKCYSPYGTVASLYLWAIARGAVPELKDPAKKRKHLNKTVEKSICQGKQTKRSPAAGKQY